MNFSLLNCNLTNDLTKFTIVVQYLNWVLLLMMLNEDVVAVDVVVIQVVTMKTVIVKLDYGREIAIGLQ